MSRINSLTNRKIKIGKRAYNNLISQGFIDDGVSIRLPSPILKIENHNRTIKQDDPAYDNFIRLGYTLDNNILRAPEPIRTSYTFDNDSHTFINEITKPIYESIANLDGVVKINGFSIRNIDGVVVSYSKFITSIIRDMYSHLEEKTYTLNIVWSPNVLPEFGVLYNSSNDQNCVIKLFEAHLIEQDKNDPELIKLLYERYGSGFFIFDFEYIATKLQAKIHVKSPFSTKIYGKNTRWKNLYLTVNNNHSTKTIKQKREVVWVDNIDDILHTVIDDLIDYRKDSAILTNTHIYKNKVLKVVDNDTIREYDVLNTPFNFYSEIGYYMNKFLLDNPKLIEIKPTHKNIEAIRTISQHGLTYITDRDCKHYCYDIKGAYTNFQNWDIYEGIPTDLDSCVCVYSESLLEYAGFALITYKDLYNSNFLQNQSSITRWVSFPYIKMLNRQNRPFVFSYALISRNKTDLNLSAFQSPTVHKRDWHKVIGRINKKMKTETFTTTDPLIAYSGLSSLSHTVVSQGHTHILHFASRLVDKPNSSYYPHISAYIQFYTEILLDELAFECQKLGGNVLGVWIDEIITDIPMEVSNLWHTDKISKITTYKNPIFYKPIVEPVKYSSVFNNILQNKGNRIKITGIAGSGKSYMSNQLSNQMELEILTPTHESGQQFTDRGHTYQTVQAKIKRHTSTNNILVDECSMINDDTRLELEALNPNLLLFTGDDKQLDPVEGIPLDDSTYTIYELTTAFRQASDPEFARKLNILRDNYKTELSFGTDINEEQAISIGKSGGIIACVINRRVNFFNSKCNDGMTLKVGSRVRFTKTVINKYYNGLLGVVVEDIEGSGILYVKTKYPTLIKLAGIKDIELSYAMTVHKLQGKTLKQPLVYDDMIHTNFRNIRYTAYSRLIRETDLYILNKI
jgi:hypothetical protein